MVVSGVALRSMLSKAMQPLKALVPMVVSCVALRSRLSKPWQPLKALLPMVVTVGGTVTEASCSQ